MIKTLSGFDSTPYVIRDGVETLTTNKPEVKLELMRIDSSSDLGDRVTTKYCGNLWVKNEIFHFEIICIQGIAPHSFELCCLTLGLFEIVSRHRYQVDTLGSLLIKLNHRRQGLLSPYWIITGPSDGRTLQVRMNLRAFNAREISTGFATLIKEATTVSSIARQLAVTHEQTLKRAEEILEQRLSS